MFAHFVCACVCVQAALRWLQKNIRAFGGEPGKITIMGESAGGHSVFMHLLMPDSDGLFFRGVISSAAPPLLNTLDESLAFGVSFAKRLGCEQTTTPQLIACLLAAPAQNITAVGSALINPLFLIGANRTNNFFPVVDNQQIIAQPLKLIQTQDFNPVGDVIIGTMAVRVCLCGVCFFVFFLFSFCCFVLFCFLGCCVVC